MIRTVKLVLSFYQTDSNAENFELKLTADSFNQSVFNKQNKNQAINIVDSTGVDFNQLSPVLASVNQLSIER